MTSAVEIWKEVKSLEKDIKVLESAILKRDKTDLNYYRSGKHDEDMRSLEKLVNKCNRLKRSVV